MSSIEKKLDPQIEIYRKLAPWQRLASACQLYWFAREIIKGRIKRKHPDISKEELEKKIRAYL